MLVVSRVRLRWCSVQWALGLLAGAPCLSRGVGYRIGVDGVLSGCEARQKGGDGTSEGLHSDCECDGVDNARVGGGALLPKISLLVVLCYAASRGQ